MPILYKKLTFLVLVLSVFSAVAQKGHKIEFKINKYQGEDLVLAYHKAGKQYVLDTLQRSKSGKFIKQGKDTLQSGMYVAFFPSLKRSFDFLVDSQDSQQFKIETDTLDFVKNAKVSGSKENNRFYNYLSFLNEKRSLKSEVSEAIAELKKDSIANLSDIQEKQENIEVIEAQVTSYQESLIQENPNSFTAKIIAINLPVVVPDSLKKNPVKKYNYYKNHFLDQVPFSDHRFARTSLINPKLDAYLSRQVTVQNTDTVKVTIDKVLKLASKNQEIYKSTLLHLLNSYAQAKVVCMDAIYVYLADTYFTEEKVDWLSEKQLKKIANNANDMRKSLCDLKAPNMKMELLNTDGLQFKTLHEIDSRYTIIFMWNPECGHCKKSMPAMKSFYEDYKDYGITIYSVCTKPNKEKKECADFIIKKGLNDWINVVAPAEGSRYVLDYNLHTTPEIFVLDRNKKILIKDIGVKQLSSVMDKILKRKK